MPLYSIAMGPDPARGELRGHARGVIAIGDLATGVVALGGIARGLVAIGGLALGGDALGWVAVGGGAVGVYAAGGGALGEHVMSATVRDPEAVRFFSELGLRFFSGR